MVPISVAVPLLPLHFLAPPQALVKIIVKIKAMNKMVVCFITEGVYNLQRKYLLLKYSS